MQLEHRCKNSEMQKIMHNVCVMKYSVSKVFPTVERESSDCTEVMQQVQR